MESKNVNITKICKQDSTKIKQKLLTSGHFFPKKMFVVIYLFSIIENAAFVITRLQFSNWKYSALKLFWDEAFLNF